MRIVARRHLLGYARTHPTCRPPIEIWLTIAARARWRQPMDVKATFRNCKILDGDRVRFELGSHRLIVSVSYAGQALWVKFIGTHDEYDAVDASSVEMF